MNKILTLIIVLILTFSVKAQSQYNDFVVSNKSIIALDESEKLIFFDQKTGEKIDSLDIPSKAVFLTKDKLGEIVVVNETNEVLKYEKDKKTWEQITNSKAKIFGVLFDSENTCFLITENGIKNTKTKKQYFSKKSLNNQIHYKKKWGNPYTYYIDNNDRIWIGFGYGEWGGNIFIFDTKKSKFLKPKLNNFEIELWPIKSFFETDNNVYLSSGLQHMMTSSIIVKFDDKLNVTELYNSETDWENSVEGEYIGPATYNKLDNSIYYYSQEGIKKGKLNSDLSKKENWKLVIKPKLHWVYGQPDAVGSPMNVLKLTILDNSRLVFLSQNDGIGIFNGKELIMLR